MHYKFAMHEQMRLHFKITLCRVSLDSCSLHSEIDNRRKEWRVFIAVCNCVETLNLIQ